MSSAASAPVHFPKLTIPQGLSRTFPSLENRNFRLLLSGLLVSGTGGWIQRIAQDWLVLTITDSPTAVGVVTAFQFAPTILLGLQGGLLADRLPKRALLLATQVSMSLTAAVLAVLTLTGVSAGVARVRAGVRPGHHRGRRQPHAAVVRVRGGPGTAAAQRDQPGVRAPSRSAR